MPFSAVPVTLIDNREGINMSLANNLRRAGGAAIMTVALTSAAQAAMVTLEGDNVSFTYDDATPFGTAVVVGDALMFSPTEFTVESLNGVGYESYVAALNVTVEAKAGSTIAGIQLMEQGNYKLNGDGSEASLEGALQVSSLTQLDGFFPFTNSTVYGGSVSDGDGDLTPWDVSASLSLSDAAGWESDTAVNVLVQNLLGGLTSADESQAFASKTFLGLGVELGEGTEIPLPAAGWLFGVALAGLVARSRRSS